jgi:hypothetical protein
MKLLTKTLGLTLAAAAACVVCGAAATLALGSQSLSAGNTSVSACGGVSSLSATRNVDNSGNVTQVNVAGIPAACSGETLSVTLVGSGSNALGSASTTLGSCGATCSASLTSFGGTISAANVTAYSFGLTGA